MDAVPRNSAGGAREQDLREAGGEPDDAGARSESAQQAGRGRREIQFGWPPRRARRGVPDLDVPRPEYHLGYRATHRKPDADGRCRRSEEHTSELQSLLSISYTVSALQT